jgi:ankyrin repeat protein
VNGTVGMSSDLDALISAVVAGDLNGVCSILDAGIDINASNENGETAFSYACAYNQLEVAQLLFSRGANVDTVDAGGGSPLDWAVCHASPEFREWLVSVGGERHDRSYEPWPWPPGNDCRGDCEHGQ